MGNDTAAAMTIDAVVDNENSGLAVLPDIGSPEAFKARIDREEKMRKILQDYVRRNMKPGHHFYTELGSTKLEKPALKQEGAHNVASLFKLIFGVPVQDEKYFEDGHYQCKTTIDIFNAQGERIATGLGICTTKESKYRWRKESRTCPDCGVPAIFKDNRSPQGGWYCWAKRDGCGAKFKAGDESIEGQQIGRIENPDLADSYNTVTKMSLKRAKVGGICQVPLVSEIFAPGEDDEDDDDERPPAKATAGNGSAKPNGNTSAPPQSQPQESFVKKATELANKLVMNYAVEMEALAMQFLPEDVGRFDDLSEAQAEGIVPDLVELVNSKIAESRKK